MVKIRNLENAKWDVNLNNSDAQLVEGRVETQLTFPFGTK